MAFLVPILGAVGSAAGAFGGAVAGIGGLAQSLGLISSLVSGVASFASSMAQANAYKIQATNALIQANSQAQEYQRQGIAVLNRTLETRSLINARAGAGGIDPFSGSPSALAEYAMGKGVDEFNFARTNVDIAMLSGRANQAAYLSAASSTRAIGAINLVGTSLMGVARMGGIGGPPSLQPTISAPYGAGGYTGFGPFIG
jgi:hypothetical protein